MPTRWRVRFLFLFLLSSSIFYSHLCFAIVWKKIQADQAKREFKSEEMEEFEDQQGNVFNKKTYEDLRRQGLL